jgi:hypothetical protein
VLADPRAEAFDVFGLYGCYTDVRLKLLGSYQRANAAVAVAAVELFNRAELDSQAVRTALAGTQVPGRLEIISTQPLCIFDGSHNPPHGRDHAFARPDPREAQADRGRVGAGFKDALQMTSRASPTSSSRHRARVREP